LYTTALFDKSGIATIGIFCPGRAANTNAPAQALQLRMHVEHQLFFSSTGLKAIGKHLDKPPE
jgi:hypothetical protein